MQEMINMVEYVRSTNVTCKLEIDTNKMTYREVFRLDDYESFDEFLKDVKDWYERNMDVTY